MTPDILFVIGILFLGFLLFTTELFSIDLTAMIILTILFVMGYLTPQEALSGFSKVVGTPGALESGCKRFHTASEVGRI